MKECELCGNEAVFRDQYPDGSGGYDCLEHGPELTRLDFRIKNLRNQRLSYALAHSLEQLIDGQWVPLNYLTLKPYIEVPPLPPHQQSIVTMLEVLMTEEIGIEMEMQRRWNTNRMKPFEETEDPQLIKEYYMVSRSIGDLYKKALAEQDKGFFERLRRTEKRSKKRPLEARGREEYRLACEYLEEKPKISEADFVRLTRQFVKAFREMDPDLKRKWEEMRGKVVNLLTQALQDGMEYLDLVQILAVVHGLPVTNKDIKRWVSST